MLRDSIDSMCKDRMAQGEIKANDALKKGQIPARTSRGTSRGKKISRDLKNEDGVRIYEIWWTWVIFF